MAKKKSSVNWYLLIAGAIVLYFGISKNKSSDGSIESKPIVVELSNDIVNVKGRKSSMDYKFWIKEYRNQFNILKGSITRGKHESISNLKGGQKVEVFISESDFSELGKSETDITVMGVSSNGNSLMSVAEFNKNRSGYKDRLMIFSVFGGFMLLINGLMQVPKRINYALAGAFVGALLVMRIFEFGLY